MGSRFLLVVSSLGRVCSTLRRDNSPLLAQRRNDKMFRQSAAQAAAKKVIICNGPERLDECRKALQQPVLACDCEGVDLGRHGRITLVQVSTPEVCVLFDVVNESPTTSSEIMAVLKEILEDKQRIKVIHDCRMDSDALLHHLGIRLAGVHDTSAWERLLTHETRYRSVNDVLGAYGLPVNPKRDCGVYDQDPSFWARRPLSQQMVKWASQDVASLFLLCDAQLSRVGPEALGFCEQASADALAHRNALTEVMLLDPYMLGRFIGPRGSNVRQMEQQTGAKIYTGRSPKGTIIMYARTKESLEKARRAAAPYV